nr:hypothetical protein LTR85_009319 [Meristemomyces frigidus]
MADPLVEDPLEAIPVSDDTASDFSGDSGFSEATLSTASLRSSIYDYEEDHGRSYHAFRRGKYVVPNDEPEQERMEIHHHSMRMLLEGKHYVAPVTRPTSILDIGTGTGIWAIDVADAIPAAHVIGIDLSPIQPTTVPPNLEFQIMDADESWDFHERFDLIHTQFMNGFSINSWPFFYHQAFISMQPGGWVENQEFDLLFKCDDGTQPPDCATVRWGELWNQGVEAFGAGLTGRCHPEVMKQQMEEAGFINVTIQTYRLPVGPWPKDKRLRQAGLYNAVAIHEGLHGLSLRTFTHGLKWPIEEMEAFLAQVRKGLEDRRIHSYFPVYASQNPCR